MHEIFQAKIFEWVAIPFSRGPSWPRDWTHTDSEPSEPPGKSQSGESQIPSHEDVRAVLWGTEASGQQPEWTCQEESHLRRGRTMGFQTMQYLCLQPHRRPWARPGHLKTWPQTLWGIAHGYCCFKLLSWGKSVVEQQITNVARGIGSEERNKAAS